MSFVAVAEAVILLLFTAALTWEIVTARKRARRDFPHVGEATAGAESDSSPPRR